MNAFSALSPKPTMMKRPSFFFGEEAVLSL
jgi:hypothetical protein